MEHFIEKKIYYHDTDCGGVVYYANYLKYFEEARTEYLLSKGLDLKKLAQTEILFVVNKVEVKYHSPARYGEHIRVYTTIKHLRHTSIIFHQMVKREDVLLVEADTQLVCVDKEFKPRIIPHPYAESLNVIHS